MTRSLARPTTPSRIALALVVLVLAAGCGGRKALPGTATSADRAAWRALLNWPESCERSWIPQAGAGIAGIWPVAGGRLVAVDCSLGAYQGTSMLYLVGHGRKVTGPLAVSIYKDPGSGVPTRTRTTLLLGNLAFAPPDRIAVLDKARGLGDCGIYSTLRLSGRRLVPVETRAKPACDGKPPYDGRLWPRLVP